MARAKTKKLTPPVEVACRHCGALAKPDWVKKRDLPAGITMLGFYRCPDCKRSGSHFEGHNDAIAEAAAMLEEHEASKIRRH